MEIIGRSNNAKEMFCKKQIELNGGGVGRE